MLAQPDKSIGDEDSGNLIVHGDNLHALKALLPRYAGKVDCIFIDPPYNTGNENWCYNDNVNSPVMREWLDSNPVNKEDMLKHDKWLSMMYPRLKLLHELLADGGKHKFILVECEDYADTLTAERVRRVINGYEFHGTQKEELYREKITWSNFSKDGPRHKLLQHVQSLENLDGLRFDSIKKEIKDGELIVTGETKVAERAAGLGGGFTFYTLGEALDIDKILTGETLPDYQTLGAWLFHTATGQPLNAGQTEASRWYLGQSDSYHVWLIYRPDLDFLKSREAALTLSLAEQIGNSHKDKQHLVFAPAKYAPNKMLLPLGVEHAPLPFALYRMEKD